MSAIGRLPNRSRRPLWRRLFLLLFVVLAALLLANAGLIAYRAAQQPALPAPGELVYVTTFDAFNDQWSQFPGQVRASIADGQLQLASDAPAAGGYSELNQVFTDFDLRVEATWQASKSQADSFGVLFRIQDPENYYMFKIRADGAYRVELVSANVVEVLSQWQVSPHVRKGEASRNQLRVVAQNYLFYFYANDQLLPLCLRGNEKRSTWSGLNTGECLTNGGRTRDEVVDPTFRSGRFGLGVVAGEAGVAVNFDNLTVLGPR
jgi:hypothetical protein